LLAVTTFLFEASKFHDRARALLASEGFSEKTLKAINVTSGAYKRTWDRARTAQGRAAVYGRVLRLLGESDAAKQRLGVDPYIESPFSLEGAMASYDELHRARNGRDWEQVGFAATPSLMMEPRSPCLPRRQNPARCGPYRST
jgi:hypothetical protein